MIQESCVRGNVPCATYNEDGSLKTKCKHLLAFPCEITEGGITKVQNKEECAFNWQAILAFESAKQTWRMEAAISSLRDAHFKVGQQLLEQLPPIVPARFLEK